MLEKTDDVLSSSSDYNASDDTSADDEETIANAEAEEEGASEKGDEIGELEKDQDVPLEELIARYVKKRDSITESSGGGSVLSEEESEEESEISDGEEADMEISTPSSAKEIDIELG